MKKILNKFLGAGLTCVYLMSAGCGNTSPPPASISNPSAANTVIAVNQPDTAKLPAAPTGVTATSGINKVTLSWDAVTGADSYNVYWSVNPGVTTATGTKITGATNPYQHVGLYVSRVYFYVVTAVSSTGESPASEQASTVAATDSANLYTTYCAVCHGPVTTTTIMGGTSDNIKAAIANNTGGMGALSALTANQLDVISQQLPCH